MPKHKKRDSKTKSRKQTGFLLRKGSPLSSLMFRRVNVVDGVPGWSNQESGDVSDD